MRSLNTEERGDKVFRQKGLEIPSNVRNFTPRIGGFDARKISSLVILFILSAITFHFSILASISIAVVGVIFILIPLGEDFFPVYFFNRLVDLTSRKKGSVKVEVSIDCSNGICVFRSGKRFFSAVEIGATPFQLMTPAEISAEVIAVSGTIDQLTSEVEIVTFPVSANPMGYSTGSDNIDSADYDGLIDFLISGTVFHRPYFFLSIMTHNAIAPPIDILTNDAKNLSEGLSRAGIHAAVVSTAEAGKKVIGMMG